MFRGDVQDGIRGKTRHGLGRSFVRASRRNQTGDWSTVSSIRQEHVPDSWAVVRDVCDRLVSEFAWARLQGWYQRYRKEGLDNHAEPNCTTFNKWVTLVMQKYQEDSDVEDCHLIPQWCYASKVDKILPLTEHLERDIRQMDPRLKYVDLHHKNQHSHVVKKMNVSCGCLTPANLKAVQSHFLEDFVHLRSILGPSKYEPKALSNASIKESKSDFMVDTSGGQAMQDAASVGKQAMLSVAGFEKSKLVGLCEDARKSEGPEAVCQIANELFPKGFSCAGTDKAIQKLKELADEGGALQAKVLKTSGGFHTSLMAPAKAKLGQAGPVRGRGVSSFRRLLASMEAERDQIRNAWQRLAEERDLTTEQLEKLRQETEEWCYREKLKIDTEWQRLNKLSEEMQKMWPRNCEVLQINCSGELFVIPRETLCGIEGSVLSEMFSPDFMSEIPRDEFGRFFLDFNPQCFSLVVEYLRNRRLNEAAPLPVVPQSQKRNMELLAEAWKLWPFLKPNRLNPLHGTSLHVTVQVESDLKETQIVRATHPGWQVLGAEQPLPVSIVSYFEVQILHNPDTRGGLAIGVCDHLPSGPETHSIHLQSCVLYNSNNGLLGDCIAEHDVKGGLMLAEGERLGISHDVVSQTLQWYHNGQSIGKSTFRERALARKKAGWTRIHMVNFGFGSPELPKNLLKHSVYMNATAEALKPGTDPKVVVDLLKKQLTSPVLWEPSMQKMITSGITDFYECGPNKQIKAMMKRINPKAWGSTTNVEV
ncbi:Malonyl-CoA-acyl carrier protein transacylase [Durusdinium trenchii]|uniref:Mitochondrial (MCT) (Mitochondrial malonyl CoA:ACP acyltransferase) (Mitochondrial malonyltransferase) ([Acyl-carrier-protein] malonyltransferase) n=1 Tax=Durusdinium trenchii TaxID=1381693 RepID=A0ABP0HEQ9_9DINO